MVKKTKEDTQKTRELLLDAAERMFLHKGVSQTTLADIATEAGMTRGAVYWHFNNKQNVLIALCRRAQFIGQNNKTGFFPAHSDDPLDVLRNQCVQTLFKCLTNSHILNLIQILHQKFELTEETEYLFVEISNHMAQTIDEIENFLHQAVKDGTLPADYDVSLASTALKAYHHGLMDSYLIFPHKFPLKERLEDYIDLFFRGLIPR